MPAHATIWTRIVDARARLGSSVDGLHRGVTRVRGYVASPWFQIGAAAAAGFLLGRRSCPREPDIPPANYPSPETIVHAVVRAALVALTTSAVTLTTSAIRHVILGDTTEGIDIDDRVRA